MSTHRQLIECKVDSKIEKLNNKLNELVEATLTKFIDLPYLNKIRDAQDYVKTCNQSGKEDCNVCQHGSELLTKYPFLEEPYINQEGKEKFESIQKPNMNLSLEVILTRLDEILTIIKDNIVSNHTLKNLCKLKQLLLFYGDIFLNNYCRDHSPSDTPFKEYFFVLIQQLQKIPVFFNDLFKILDALDYCVREKPTIFATVYANFKTTNESIKILINAYNEFGTSLGQYDYLYKTKYERPDMNDTLILDTSLLFVDWWFETYPDTYKSTSVSQLPFKLIDFSKWALEKNKELYNPLLGKKTKKPSRKKSKTVPVQDIKPIYINKNGIVEKVGFFEKMNYRNLKKEEIDPNKSGIYQTIYIKKSVHVDRIKYILSKIQNPMNFELKLILDKFAKDKERVEEEKQVTVYSIESTDKNNYYRITSRRMNRDNLDDNYQKINDNIYVESAYQRDNDIITDFIKKGGKEKGVVYHHIYNGNYEIISIDDDKQIYIDNDNVRWFIPNEEKYEYTELTKNDLQINNNIGPGIYMKNKTRARNIVQKLKTRKLNDVKTKLKLYLAEESGTFTVPNNPVPNEYKLLTPFMLGLGDKVDTFPKDVYIPTGISKNDMIKYFFNTDPTFFDKYAAMKIRKIQELLDEYNIEHKRYKVFHRKFTRNYKGSVEKQRYLKLQRSKRYNSNITV